MADDTKKDIALDQDGCAQAFQLPHFEIDITERWFIATMVEGCGESDGKVGVVYRHRISGRPLVILYKADANHYYTLFFQLTPGHTVKIEVPLVSAEKNITDYIQEVDALYKGGTMEQVPEDQCQPLQERVLSQILKVNAPPTPLVTKERVIVKGKRRAKGADKK